MDIDVPRGRGRGKGRGRVIPSRKDRKGRGRGGIIISSQETGRNREEKNFDNAWKEILGRCNYKLQ